MPHPGIITPSYTDKVALERLLWTAIHHQALVTGWQARRWLFVLAGRMHQVEARFPTAMAGSPARQAIEMAYDRAERVKREFQAHDIPLHLRALRELQRRPFDRWEHLSWWSGAAKISHRVARAARRRS